jgi:hypothetical protein
LNENATNYAINANTILNVGSLGKDGTILWHTNAGSIITFAVGGAHVQAAIFGNERDQPDRTWQSTTLGLSEEGISERRGGGRCEAVPA